METEKHLKRLSDVVSGIVELARTGRSIDARTEAVRCWDDIDADGQYMAGIEGVTARIVTKAKSIRLSLAKRAAEKQSALPFDLPEIVPIDIEGRKLRPTRDLSEEEFERAVFVREKQIEHDQDSLREWKRAGKAAKPFWIKHPDWTFGHCLNAIMQRKPVV